MSDVLCDKIAQCSPPGDSSCKTQFVQFCCMAQTNCDADTGGTQAELDACLDAYEALSCPDVLDGTVPTQCQ